MKKIPILLFIIIAIFAIHDDLTGQTPAKKIVTPKETVQKETVQKATTTPKEQTKPTKPFITVPIKSGDTLLSISEKQNGQVPIQKLITDFEALNIGVEANELKIGKTYKIPLYH